MKRGHSACATTSKKAVKIARELVMLGILARFFVNSNKTALNQKSTCKAKHFLKKILRK